MRTRRLGRENGSVFVIILMGLVFILALAAGVSQVTLFSLRTANSSDLSRRLFYLADSGSQIGNAKIRASNGTIANTTFTENIASGSVTVAIEKISATLYRVTSTGTLEGQQQTAQIHMEITSGFNLQGALEVNIQNGAEVDGNPEVEFVLSNNSLISGMDHDATGALLADQSDAVHGLALKPLPGGMDFNVTLSAGASVEGVPAPTTNTATDQSVAFKALRAYARDNADIVISGSKTLKAVDTGNYGTPLAQKLVYVSLGENGKVSMTDTFTGYGTLVIYSSNSDTSSVMEMVNTASWNGLILIYFRGEAEIDGGSLIRIKDDAKITGGLAMFFNTSEIELEGSGKLISLQNQAKILYSNSLVANSKGVSAVSTNNLKVISYTVQ